MEESTKSCPFCGEEILVVAKKCKHCSSFLDESASPSTLVSKTDYSLLLLIIPVVATVLIWTWVSFMNMLQSPGDAMILILLATLLGTASIATVEAKKTRAQSDKEGGTYRPATWFFLIAIFWTIGYPLYFYKRKTMGLSNRLIPGIIISLIFTISWVLMFYAIEARRAELLNSFDQIETELGEYDIYEDLEMEEDGWGESRKQFSAENAKKDSDSEKDISQENSLSTNAVLTADELYSDYRNTSTRSATLGLLSSEKYDGKEVKVSGIFGGIGTDPDGPYMTFTITNKESSVYAYFSASQEADFTKLSLGQNVTIKAEVQGILELDSPIFILINASAYNESGSLEETIVEALPEKLPSNENSSSELLGTNPVTAVNKWLDKEMPEYRFLYEADYDSSGTDNKIVGLEKADFNGDGKLDAAFLIIERKESPKNKRLVFLHNIDSNDPQIAENMDLGSDTDGENIAILLQHYDTDTRFCETTEDGKTQAYSGNIPMGHPFLYLCDWQGGCWGALIFINNEYIGIGIPEEGDDDCASFSVDDESGSDEMPVSVRLTESIASTLVGPSIKGLQLGMHYEDAARIMLGLGMPPGESEWPEREEFLTDEMRDEYKSYKADNPQYDGNIWAFLRKDKYPQGRPPHLGGLWEGKGPIYLSKGGKLRGAKGEMIVELPPSGKYYSWSMDTDDNGQVTSIDFDSRTVFKLFKVSGMELEEFLEEFSKAYSIPEWSIKQEIDALGHIKMLAEYTDRETGWLITVTHSPSVRWYSLVLKKIPTRANLGFD